MIRKFIVFCALMSCFLNAETQEFIEQFRKINIDMIDKDIEIKILLEMLEESRSPQIKEVLKTQLIYQIRCLIEEKRRLIVIYSEQLNSTDNTADPLRLLEEVTRFKNTIIELKKFQEDIEQHYNYLVEVKTNS